MSSTTAAKKGTKRSASTAPTAPKVILPVPKKQTVKRQLPQNTIEGTLIKINVREHGQYTFYDGMLAVEKVVYNSIVEWGNSLGFTGDYNPYWSADKEYNGEVTTSYYIKFDIKGENISNADELAFLKGLADIKSPVKSTFGATVATFTGKDGEEKKKFALELIFNTTTQAL